MQPQLVQEPRNQILVRNRSYKEGRPGEKYHAFSLPEDALGAEVRVNALGYSIYFDRKETRERTNPTSEILVLEEERVAHFEFFFNEDFEEMAIWKRFTEWTPVIDRTILHEKGVSHIRQ